MNRQSLTVTVIICCIYILFMQSSKVAQQHDLYPYYLRITCTIYTRMMNLDIELFQNFDYIATFIDFYVHCDSVRK
jgi:hypothetical protein